MLISPWHDAIGTDASLKVLFQSPLVLKGFQSPVQYERDSDVGAILAGEVKPITSTVQTARIPSILAPKLPVNFHLDTTAVSSQKLKVLSIYFL